MLSQHIGPTAQGEHTIFKGKAWCTLGNCRLKDKKLQSQVSLWFRKSSEGHNSTTEKGPLQLYRKHMKDACSLKTELTSWDSSKEVFLKWWKSIWVETIFMQDTFTNIKGPWLLGLLEAILKYINITMNFSHQFHQLKLYLFDLGSSLTFLICKMETTEHSWIFCED